MWKIVFVYPWKTFLFTYAWYPLNKPENMNVIVCVCMCPSIYECLFVCVRVYVCVFVWIWGVQKFGVSEKCLFCYLLIKAWKMFNIYLCTLLVSCCCSFYTCFCCCFFLSFMKRLLFSAGELVFVIKCFGCFSRFEIESHDLPRALW